MKRLTNPWADIEGYYCYGCSPNNPHGLHLHFYYDEQTDEVVTILRLHDYQQGWIDTLHGGIIATVLDEICCWAIMQHTQTSGVTSKMELKYKKPVSTKWDYCIVRSKVIKEQRRVITAEATIYSPDNEPCTTAQCIYFCYTHKQAEELEFKPCVTEGEDLTIEDILKG